LADVASVATLALANPDLVARPKANAGSNLRTGQHDAVVSGSGRCGTRRDCASG